MVAKAIKKMRTFRAHFTSVFSGPENGVAVFQPGKTALINNRQMSEPDRIMYGGQYRI
jgi:hypothetical protein